MWGLLRPDTVGALEDPLVKKILPRYVKVAKDQLPARFQIAKTVYVGFEEKMPVDELWEMHSEGMNEFYKLQDRVDRKGGFKELSAVESSLFDLKVALTKEIMRSCELCERMCHVDRIKGEKGFCKVGNQYSISSEFIHMGEESHISPSHTIFFMGCTMSCQYCQNWSISHWYDDGYSVPKQQMVSIIDERRKEGARNLNLVGGEPTPNLAYILDVLKECRTNIPIVWNSNFYMSEKTMRILDGIVDMHLSDFKYGNNECGLRLSKTPRYYDVCSRNHLLAGRTTEITMRHLILPGHVECCTKPILEWVGKNARDRCLVNVMDQYRPEFNARNYPEINRSVTKEELDEAIKYARKLGINFIA